MLTINPDDIGFIIAKAREFDEKVAPSEQDSEDDMRTILESYLNDATLSELKAAIDNLNEDAQLDLVALMWLGRGDFDAQDFQSARTVARDAHDKPTADYLTGTPLLGDYLEEGLESLGLRYEP